MGYDEWLSLAHNMQVGCSPPSLVTTIGHSHLFNLIPINSKKNKIIFLKYREVEAKDTKICLFDVFKLLG